MLDDGSRLAVYQTGAIAVGGYAEQAIGTGYHVVHHVEGGVDALRLPALDAHAVDAIVLGANIQAVTQEVETAQSRRRVELVELHAACLQLHADESRAHRQPQIPFVLPQTAHAVVAP